MDASRSALKTASFGDGRYGWECRKVRKDKDKRRSGEIETSPYGGRKNNVTPSVPQIRTRQRGLADYGRKDLVEGGCDSLSVCSFQWART